MKDGTIAKLASAAMGFYAHAKKEAAEGEEFEKVSPPFFASVELVLFTNSITHIGLLGVLRIKNRSSPRTHATVPWKRALCWWRVREADWLLQSRTRGLEGGFGLKAGKACLSTRSAVSQDSPAKC